MDTAVRNFLQQLKTRDVPTLGGATDDEIDAAFAAINQPVSSDVRILYRACGGFVDAEYDYQWSWWSLNRLVEENRDFSNSHCWFADYLIHSHLYAFEYITPDRSAVIIEYSTEDTPNYRVAESVEEFLTKYCAHPDQVEAFVLDE